MAEAAAVWSDQGTTPARIEAALRELLIQRHAESEAFVPARVLNLVAVCDREWRGEIQNRLDQVGRYHASRTILCAVEDGRTTIDAVATLTAEEELAPDELAIAHEQVTLTVGPHHLENLATIVDPLVVTDIATVAWSPHGHPEAIDSLLGIAQVVLIDSGRDAVARAGARRARGLAERAYVVDLAWLRSTPWRERVAATFDPPQWRAELGRISAVTVRHQPDSTMSGLLFFGWLAHRLGWEPGAMVFHGDRLHGKAHARRGDIALSLEPDATMSSPGLAGITLETQSGMSLSLDRGPGGLSASRRTHKGEQSSWTVMGASRGESGILGEGIRQALLRDRSYGPALRRAEAMVAA